MVMLRPCPPSSASHIYQSVVDSLVHVARHLQDGDQRYELMMKALQVFVQQGIEAKRAHKVRCWSMDDVVCVPYSKQRCD